MHKPQWNVLISINLTEWYSQPSTWRDIAKDVQRYGRECISNVYLPEAV